MKFQKQFVSVVEIESGRPNMVRFAGEMDEQVERNATGGRGARGKAI